MKNLKALILIVVTLFSVSCNNDDGSQIQTNEVIAGSSRFEINEAKLFNDGTFNGITEFELYITSTGLNIDNNENFSGNGDFLSLRLFSGSSSGLEAGDYVFNQQDSNTFILNQGYHFFGYDSSLGDNQSGNLDIESGSVSVSLENDIYTITLNLVDEDGNTVTGYYNGMIQLVL